MKYLIIGIPIGLCIAMLCAFVGKKVDQAIDAWFNFLDEMDAEYEEAQSHRRTPMCTDHARLRAK